MRELFIILTFNLFTYVLLGQSLNSRINESIGNLDFEKPQESIFITQLDMAIRDKTIFMIGEAHGLAINPIYQLHFLKYLHENAGVRQLVLELSYSDAFLIDKYISTGDTKFLNEIRDSKFVDKIKFWQKVYAFNQTLEKSDRVNVIGIGRHNWPIISALYFCLPSKNVKIPLKIQKDINRIKEAYAQNKPPYHYGDNFDAKSNQKLRKNLRKHIDDPEVKTYFGDMWKHVQRISLNYAAYHPDDANMLKNFYLVSEDSNIKSMFIFGSYHCFKNRWEHKYDPLGYLLDTSNLYGGKVFTIIGYFDNCKSAFGSTLMTDGLLPFKEEDYNTYLLEEAFKLDRKFAYLPLNYFSKDSIKENKEYADILMLVKDQNELK